MRRWFLELAVTSSLALGQEVTKLPDYQAKALENALRQPTSSRFSSLQLNALRQPAAQTCAIPLTEVHGNAALDFAIQHKLNGKTMAMDHMSSKAMPACSK